MAKQKLHHNDKCQEFCRRPPRAPLKGQRRVVAADGNKLEIAFEKPGTKMVMGSFVEPV